MRGLCLPHLVVVRTLNLVIGTAAWDREKLWLDRAELYLTSAFKHFKYEPRGKRRIHQRPNMGEVQHCRWWLKLELDLIKPKIVVAMGATALASLTETKHKLTDIRGQAMRMANGRLLFTTCLLYTSPSPRDS